MLSLENWVIPVNYNLNLNISPVETNFNGEISINLKAKDINFTSFKLHSHNLVITNAILSDSDDNSIFLKVTYDKSNQLVQFNAADSENSTTIFSDTDLLLHLKYLGQITTINNLNDKTTGIFKSVYNNKTIIATHSQPVYARSIFPCIDEPNQKVTFNLEINTLSTMKVISNTNLIDVIKFDNKKSIFKFGKTPLMNPSIFGLSIGDFDLIKVSTKSINNNTIPITIYSPENVNAATFVLDTIKNFLPIIENFFNFAYPLKKLDFVLLPFLSDMAMENFGMITLQMSNFLLPPSLLSNKSIVSQLEQVIVHELVHQWIGNYITFDSWDHLWFNESFATFLACLLVEQQENGYSGYFKSADYLDIILATTVEKDLSSESKSIVSLIKDKISSTSSNLDGISTNNLFDPQAYNKGIIILRSFEQCVGYENFQKACQSLFSDENVDFHSTAYKPMDLWVHFSETLKSKNISSYFYTSTKFPGIPIVSLSFEENSKTKLVQHRFITDVLDQNDFEQYEDVPYNIPLLSDKQLHSDLLTDRSLELYEEVLLLNNESQGFYIVSYESLKSYKMFIEKILKNEFSENNLFKIFSDILLIISTKLYQKPIHVRGTIYLLENIASSISKIDLNKYGIAIAKGLEVLQVISNSGVLAEDDNKYEDNLLKSIILPLLETIRNTKESSFKDQLLSQLYFLGRKDPSVFKDCSEYYEQLFQGPKRSVPYSLISAIYTVISTNIETIKQWKKFSELTRNSKSIETNVKTMSTDNIQDKLSISLQNFALENVSFSVNHAIIEKVLNFINDSIDIPGIEVTLFGFTFNSNKIVQETKTKEESSTDVEKISSAVWKWYVKNFEEWERMTKKKTARAEKIAANLSMITMVVFQICYPINKANITDFVNKKTGDDKEHRGYLTAALQEAETRLIIKEATFDNLKHIYN